MNELTILIPTCNRAEALAVTLTSLFYQRWKNFNIIISDQSEDERIYADGSLTAIVRLLEAASHPVTILRNTPSRGMAQQRQYLLDLSEAPYSLFLDDDLILEPFVIGNLLQVLKQEQCGFTGNAPIGLSYKEDTRPHQQQIEFWEERVCPETVLPDRKEWERYQLHNAANIYHVQRKFHLFPDAPRRYKIAWIGGCVLYDTEKLRDAGGFSFWDQLPVNHCGEEVLAQLKVMKKYGACGVLPSGVYHQELPTTIWSRRVNAPEYLSI